MNKYIDANYSLLVLVEILFEKELINKPTFNAIQSELQNKKSHVSQQETNDL